MPNSTAFTALVSRLQDAPAIVRSEGDAERLFTELAEGGIVRMPLQETFWAHRFGVLTDRFAIPWAINCEKSE